MLERTHTVDELNEVCGGFKRKKTGMQSQVSLTLKKRRLGTTFHHKVPACFKVNSICLLKRLIIASYCKTSKQDWPGPSYRWKNHRPWGCCQRVNVTSKPERVKFFRPLSTNNSLLLPSNTKYRPKWICSEGTRGFDNWAFEKILHTCGLRPFTYFSLTCWA